MTMEKHDKVNSAERTVVLFEILDEDERPGRITHFNSLKNKNTLMLRIWKYMQSNQNQRIKASSKLPKLVWKA